MSIFAALFEHLIGWFYQISQDYGVAIVMITVCVRLLLLPLNCKQRKVAGEQKEIAEEAERIRRKYTNKERQEAELARLYREKGTGMGGCFRLWNNSSIISYVYEKSKYMLDLFCVLKIFLDSCLNLFNIMSKLKLYFVQKELKI